MGIRGFIYKHIDVGFVALDCFKSHIVGFLQGLYFIELLFLPSNY